MSIIHARVELRDGGDGSPGILGGTLMRYGTPGVRGREVFAPGALRWPDNGIRLDLEHASSPVRGSVQPPIMRAVPAVPDDGAEVRIEAALPDTQAARDLAALMRMSPPVYTGLSVEFHAKREHCDAAGRRVVDDALLDGAALTDQPAYPSTRVEVRRCRERMAARQAVYRQRRKAAAARPETAPSAGRLAACWPIAPVGRHPPGLRNGRGGAV